MSKTKAPQLDWRDGRRQRAWELKQQGWKQTAIAAALGVTPGAVSQWLKRARTQGVEALRGHPAAGPTPRLTAEQRAQIPALVARGAPAWGFVGEVWTCRRVAEVIRRTCGVTYHPAHVYKLLTNLEHSVQRPAPGRPRHPARRGRHRHLVAQALATPQKKATEEGRTIVWVDQSGCYLLPMAVRTWAPRRHTPILRVPLTHDHLAAIGGLTPDGRLFVQTQAQSYHSTDVVRFLRLLLRKIAGKLLVIWDGAPIHRGQPIKEFLARRAAKRLHLAPLPGYAPELNPVEGVWNYLKRVELGNVCCPELSALGLALRRAKERLRHKRRVLLGCIAECGYHV